MKDNFGREIKYMRISITDRCNNRCMYCMPEEGVCKREHSQSISFESIEKMVKVGVSLGITKYRITGGEPLVRKGIVGLVEKLSKIEGIEDLAMTTNGILLDKYGEDLKKAGLKRINISLDTFVAEKYKYITRLGNIEDVKKGIKKALELGFDPVKINVVAIKGFNDDELLDFANLTIDNKIDIRFIEYMPIGELSKETSFDFISKEEIKKKFDKDLIALERDGSVAELYKFENALGRIGFISAMSDHFCGSCNKIRLTSDGKIKPCLHSNIEIDVMDVLKYGNEEDIKKSIEDAIKYKEKSHYLGEGGVPIDRNMNRIGG